MPITSHGGKSVSASYLVEKTEVCGWGSGGGLASHFVLHSNSGAPFKENEKVFDSLAKMKTKMRPARRAEEMLVGMSRKKIVQACPHARGSKPITLHLSSTSLRACSFVAQTPFAGHLPLGLEATDFDIGLYYSSTFFQTLYNCQPMSWHLLSTKTLSLMMARRVDGVWRLAGHRTGIQLNP